MAVITLPKPHPAQEEFLRNRRRFNVLKCGRRWGKTEVCQILTSEIIGQAGITGYWSPTYKDLAEVWNTFKNVFYPIIEKKDEQLKAIQFRGGSKIDFWSMEDPNSGRGRKYHRAIMDECEKAGKFQEAWEQAIRPTLIDYQGDAYFLSTPKFGDTFFKKLCKYQDQYPNWKTFIYSSFTNPHLSQKEIEEMAIDMHQAVYDCEILALDVDGKALNPFAFQFDELYHVSDRAIFIPTKPIIISIDFNLQPFAVTFSHVWQDAQGIHDWTFDEAEIQQGSIPAMIDLIRERYGRYLFAAEMTGDFMGRRGDLSQRDNASLYHQLLRGLGMSVKQLKLPKEGNPTHENSKADVNFVLFKTKQAGSKAEFIIHPSCKGTIRDFRGVQWDDLKGQIKKRDRSNILEHSDLLDGNRYRIGVYWRDFIKRSK